MARRRSGPAQPIPFTPKNTPESRVASPDGRNSGTAKAHVALGLGPAPGQRRMSVAFTADADLINEPMKARSQTRLLNLRRQLSRFYLLFLDEPGFAPLSRPGAELLFELFSQRWERCSVLVTTNLPYDEWTEAYGAERLTHHVHILELNDGSYRLKRSRGNAAPQATDDTDEE